MTQSPQDNEFNERLAKFINKVTNRRNNFSAIVVLIAVTLVSLQAFRILLH